MILGIEGFEFDALWQRRVAFDFDGVRSHMPHIDDLVALKRKAGRAQDLLDLQWLQKAKKATETG